VAAPLSADPVVRLADPRTEPALAAFTCGGSTEYEREVDRIVVGYHSQSAAPFQMFTMAETRSTPPELIACCASFSRPLPPVTPGAIYLAVIGISGAFRGRRLADRSRVGDLMLGDMLERVEASWTIMPWVSAFIHPANTPSRELFERHNFTELPSRGYALYLRPEGLAVQ